MKTVEKKSGFFLQISGERIHWLPDSYPPEELRGKEKWPLSANIRGKNTLATRQLPAGRAVRKRKVASFCEYQGKEYTYGWPEGLCEKEKWLLSANIRVKNTLATRQLPAGRAARKEKWLLSANIRGKNTLATCQLPTNYQPVTCQVEQCLN